VEDGSDVDWAAVNFLVEQGANVNQILSGGSTLLITAIKKKESHWVSHLLRDCKVDPDLVDHKCRTPLMYAVAGAADAKLCMLLLRYGAAPEPKLLPAFLK
jgi:ankyrin repeat protein